MKNNWLKRVSARIGVAVASFSVTERIVFYILVGVFAFSSILAIWNTNNDYLVAVPQSGGTLTEGIVGVPRFVNPVIASSDVDRDMTALIYSGLVNFTPKGDVVPDLASAYKISDDGRTYSFTIREEAVFQDGEPVTAEDVEFTIQKIQDPSIKSPKRAAWEGVTIARNAENPREISFTLKQRYAPFMENLSVGILPKHLWTDVPTEEFAFSNLNTSPIGSGPYKVKNVKRNSLGLPLYYDLLAFKSYALGKPYITHLVIRFYPNETELVDAYSREEIESLAGISPQYTSAIDSERSEIVRIPLGRVFGVFFNQNQASIFINKEVRLALDAAIDKEAIVKEVLAGFGRTADSPAPVFGRTNLTNLDENSVANRNIIKTAGTGAEKKSHRDEALSILTEDGWKLNETTGVMEKTVNKVTTKLAFSISTGSAPELKRAAEIVQTSWQAIGAEVDLQVFETNDLNQNVIRPRKYDALFFGEVIGRDYDLYPFWHSSQRNDPGLNIALYTNIKADKILETIRAESDRVKREKSLTELIPIIQADQPAAFIYSPDFIYVVPKNLFSLKPEKIVNANDRFADINKWYMDTNRIWKIFNQPLISNKQNQ